MIQVRQKSYRNIPIRSLLINELDFEELNTSRGKGVKVKSNSLLSQVIPALPVTKSFPTAFNRKKNLNNTEAAVSGTQRIDTSGSQRINASAVSLSNLSSIRSFSKDFSLNFSLCSQVPDLSIVMHRWSDVDLPCSPSEVVQKFRGKLTSYEATEIFKYQEVWFIGIEARKIKGSENSSQNHGFDDKSGDYRAIVNDHIAYRYELLEILGKGTFGQVFRVFDHKHKAFNALKIIKNKKRFTQQALIEIDILKHLLHKDSSNKNHIVHIQSSFSFRNHIVTLIQCITFELLSSSLYQILKSAKFQGLSLSLIKRFATQLLKALSLLSNNDIIHCDLKPENILLTHPSKSSLKLIDFGSSCFSNQKIYNYIQSRYYRAPEIILGIPYNRAIDMWSFGCVLVEMLTGVPVFCGENEAQHLLCIMEYLGEPSKEYLMKAKRRKYFFDSNWKARIVADSRGKIKTPGSKSLRKMLENAGQEFICVIEACFEWEPALRPSPEDILKSDWIIGKNG